MCFDFLFVGWSESADAGVLLVIKPRYSLVGCGGVPKMTMLL